MKKILVKSLFSNIRGAVKLPTSLMNCPVTTVFPLSPRPQINTAPSNKIRINATL